MLYGARQDGRVVMQRPAKYLTPVQFRFQPPYRAIMKVRIIGLGFVGSSLLGGLKDNIEVMQVNPKYGTSINDLFKFDPDIIFITNNIKLNLHLLT